MPVQGSGRVQHCAGPARGPRWLPVAACLLLPACSDALNGPIDLFHGLEGGQIAQHRPPPPGVGEPYPKLATVPPKPAVADAAYRQALQTQLAAERDRTERVAADRPIEPVPPPAPLPTQAGAPSGPPPTPGPPNLAPGAPAMATLQTAEAPAKPPPPPPPAPPASAAATSDGPPPGTPLTIAGAAPEFSDLPAIPDQPPAPATFEGVPAEPAPTAARVPARLPPPEAGTPIFFPPGSAELPSGQTQPLKDAISHRGARTVEVVGLGDALSDTPDGQATAIALGLARARAVAGALATLHVPPAAIRIGADAFGRGAVLRLLP